MRRRKLGLKMIGRWQLLGERLSSQYGPDARRGNGAEGENASKVVMNTLKGTEVELEILFVSTCRVTLYAGCNFTTLLTSLALLVTV